MTHAYGQGGPGMAQVMRRQLRHPNRAAKLGHPTRNRAFAHAAHGEVARLAAGPQERTGQGNVRAQIYGQGRLRSRRQRGFSRNTCKKRNSIEITLMNRR
jgi:hypothetical protein